MAESHVKGKIEKYQTKKNDKYERFCGVALYFLENYFKRKFPSLLKASRLRWKKFIMQKYTMIDEFPCQKAVPENAYF